MNYKIKKEEILLELPSNSLIAVLVGHHSINLAKLEKLIDVNINLFGNQFNISGNAENINKAKLIISNVYNKLSLKKSDISEFDFSNFETELRMINGISSNLKLNQKIDKQEDLKNKSENELKSEYKKIAHRRVKLGLIMAEVTRKSEITITQEELKQIVELQANQNPKIKDKILEFYKDPENLEKIKGPILEEKALDLILSKVKLKNTEMTTDDFVKKVLPELKENNRN